VASRSPTTPGPLDGGRLRARVLAGEATLGTFVGTASPVTAEVCAPLRGLTATEQAELERIVRDWHP